MRRRRRKKSGRRRLSADRPVAHCFRQLKRPAAPGSIVMDEGLGDMAPSAVAPRASPSLEGFHPTVQSLDQR